MRNFTFGLIGAMSLTLAIACESNSTTEDASVTSMDSGSSSAVDSSTNVGADTGPADAGPDLGAICDELGYTREAFQAGAGGNLFGDLAADFTVNQVGEEPWTLSEQWSGCESYVFINFVDQFDLPGGSYTGARYSEEIWNTSLVEIFRNSARNVHYFVVSDEADTSGRRTRIANMRTRFLDDLGFEFESDPAARAHWESHFHFVTDRTRDISGSVGAFLGDYLNYMRTATPVDLGDRGMANAPLPTAFGIGRDQHWDPVGGLSESVGGNATLRMAAFVGGFYNYRAALRARFASETDTTVLPMIDETVTARHIIVDVNFPEASAMGAFDNMEFDIAVTCNYRNMYECSEWDRIARINLCTEYDAADPNSCTATTEVIRWITPYWRRGRRRWGMDASPFLGLLQAGGNQRFKIEMGPTWERATERDAQMSIRLSTRGSVPRSRAVQRAFGGGNFNADYNTGDRAMPFAFTPPSTASRVEIVTIISGHGQESANGCAEWCNHVHTFTVNDTATHEVNYGRFNNPFGCAARTNEGVIPGQGGNWSQSRAGWCPGLPVETVRYDITSEVTLGAENTLRYRGSFNGGDPAGGNVSMNTYIVWYED